KISGNPKKLKRGEPNRCIFEHNICKIELYDKEGNVKDYAIIDPEDYEKVKDFKWGINSGGYVFCSRQNGIGFKLHRLVLGLLNNERPDHIDGKPLNNRKSNLRVCTHQENCCNTKKPKNNTSGYKGVTWEKTRNKWKAYIAFNYKCIHLGLFENKIDGAKAYNQAAIKYHGEFAKLNEL
ncbi:unnamed protein product, partial [marine sediment metagenome]